MGSSTEVEEDAEWLRTATLLHGGDVTAASGSDHQPGFRKSTVTCDTLHSKAAGILRSNAWFYRKDHWRRNLVALWRHHCADDAAVAALFASRRPCCDGGAFATTTKSDLAFPLALAYRVLNEENLPAAFIPGCRRRMSRHREHLATLRALPRRAGDLLMRFVETQRPVRNAPSPPSHGVPCYVVEVATKPKAHCFRRDFVT